MAFRWTEFFCSIRYRNEDVGAGEAHAMGT